MKLLPAFAPTTVVGLVTTMGVTIQDKLWFLFTWFLGAVYISFVVLNAVEYLLQFSLYCTCRGFG